MNTRLAPNYKSHKTDHKTENNDGNNDKMKATTFGGHNCKLRREAKIRYNTFLSTFSFFTVNMEKY